MPSAVTLPNLSFRYGILLNTTLCGILLYPLNLIVVSTLIMLPFICESYFEESRMTELKMICAVLTITYLMILKLSFLSKVKIKLLVLVCNMKNDCLWYVSPRWKKKRKKREPERERMSERELKRENMKYQLYTKFC